MMSFLPQPKNVLSQPLYEESLSLQPRQLQSTVRKPPPYGRRQGWIPRTPEDFGGGGAFPEIHVAQYPLDMGRKGKDGASSTAVVPITLDAEGKVNYDAIVQKAAGPGKTVFSKPSDAFEKQFNEEELVRPDEEEATETTAKTKAALEKVVNGKIAAAKPVQVAETPGGPSFIRYTPSQQGAAFNSGAQSRIIRMVEMPRDPLEPPKFKHKRVPRGPPSPPAPVMHSPPRKLTLKDQQDWKIPPCISNWKNPKGYTIPLDKRLATDGRGLQQIEINDSFAKLSEALYIAERNAREEVAKRAEIQKKLAQKDREKKENALRQLAQEARAGRLGGAASSIPSSGIEESSREKRRAISEDRSSDSDSEEDRRDRGRRDRGRDGADREVDRAKQERDKLREERKRDRERERRLDAAGKLKKSKFARDEDRDVSEKIALGLAAPATIGEVQYDQRLFNQSQGITSGFNNDEAYNIYDKPLFHGSSANTLYRPKKGDDDTYGGEDEQSADTTKFKPNRDFSGVDRSKTADPRSRPVEFEKEEDPFGLDEFLNDVKGGRKTLDKIGQSGHMHAGAASSGSYESSGKGRSNVDFEKGRK